MRLDVRSVASHEAESAIPEVVIIGEIFRGEGFVGGEFGLTCTWYFRWSDSWVLLEVTCMRTRNLILLVGFITWPNTSSSLFRRFSALEPPAQSPLCCTLASWLAQARFACPRT